MGGWAIDETESLPGEDPTADPEDVHQGYRAGSEWSVIFRNDRVPRVGAGELDALPTVIEPDPDESDADSVDAFTPMTGLRFTVS